MFFYEITIMITFNNLELLFCMVAHPTELEEFSKLLILKVSFNHTTLIMITIK